MEITIKMKLCSNCSKENDDDNSRCDFCDADLKNTKVSSSVRDSEIHRNISKNKIGINIIGKLILPDKTVITIDHSQRFVGMADLKKYTSNSKTIARSHFTAYKTNCRFMIKNNTDLQNSDDVADIFVNDVKLGKKIELKNGDKIMISDIEMLFRV